ncbi:hypothetical protein CHELA1G2_12606 [Hyphomicrobiales bacterium]|nr:hypothetical protein CHELA1G2_12606 [Hyphomicrobiales bacterium]
MRVSMALVSSALAVILTMKQSIGTYLHHLRPTPQGRPATPLRSLTRLI